MNVMNIIGPLKSRPTRATNFQIPHYQHAIMAKFT